MARKERVDHVNELTDKLEQGIQDVFNSEKYRDYLQTMAKFYRYSFNNTLLIFMQRPDATLVAGYGTWQKEFHRHVNRGEKGIKILAPAPYKYKVEMEKIDPVTQKPMLNQAGKPVTEMVEVSRKAFKPVTVFDVSQTDGDPLPKLTNELTGEVKDYNLFFNILTHLSPLPIYFEEIASSAKGYCNYEERRIGIKEGMSQIQTLKTTIHEIAHATLHDRHGDEESSVQDKDRHTREVEAESIAYVVCQHYGIDTSDYSFGYVVGWSSGREVKELRSSLESIRSTAKDMITTIDERINQLMNEQLAVGIQDEEYELDMEM